VVWSAFEKQHSAVILILQGILWSHGKELFLAPFGAAWKVPIVESPSPKLDRLWMCMIMRGRDRLAL